MTFDIVLKDGFKQTMLSTIDCNIESNQNIHH